MCFGEEQVSFGSFSWEFLSFCFFWFDPVLVWVVFDVFWGLRWVSFGSR